MNENGEQNFTYTMESRNLRFNNVTGDFNEEIEVDKF